MRVRTNQGVKRVSDLYKKKLAKLKRDSGTEAVRLEVSGDVVNAVCRYTGLRFTMPILPEVK